MQLLFMILSVFHISINVMKEVMLTSLIVAFASFTSNDATHFVAY